jgi:hypothetical protein
MQARLFDELEPNAPSRLDVAADRSLELEAAVGELLLNAASKSEGETGGAHDA